MLRNAKMTRTAIGNRGGNDNPVKFSTISWHGTTYMAILSVSHYSDRCVVISAVLGEKRYSIMHGSTEALEKFNDNRPRNDGQFCATHIIAEVTLFPYIRISMHTLLRRSRYYIIISRPTLFDAR